MGKINMVENQKNKAIFKSNILYINCYLKDGLEMEFTAI